MVVRGAVWGYIGVHIRYPGAEKVVCGGHGNVQGSVGVLRGHAD